MSDNTSPSHTAQDHAPGTPEAEDQMPLAERLLLPEYQYYDSQSPEERLATLKRRLILALREEAKAEPAWRFEEDYEYDLRDGLRVLNEDPVGDLLFGQPFKVTDRIYDLNFDYLANLDEQYIKGELETLLDRSFASELDDVAEALDRDPDELRETLLDDIDFTDDDDLQFTSSNILQDRSTSFNFKWRGQVAVYADLRLSPSTRPDSELAEILHRLRIPVDDYLGAAGEKITELIEDETFVPSEWGIDDEDEDKDNEIEAGAGDAVAAAASAYVKAYSDAVRDAVDTYRARHAASFDFTEPPVISTRDIPKLITLLREDWSNKGIYVSAVFGGDIIDGESTRINRHWDGKEVESIPINVASGYLSGEGDPCDAGYDDVIRIAAPISITLGEFRTHSDSPNYKDEDAAWLSSARDAYTRLYELEWRIGKDGLTSTDVETQAKRILAEAPLWKLASIADSFERLRALIDDEVSSRRAAETPETLGRMLTAALAGRPDEWRQQALWLLDNGADPNLPTNDGFRPVHLAAAAKDLELLQRLAQAGADLDVAHGELPGNAWTIAARGAAVKNSQDAPDVAVVNWLMQHGVRPPVSHHLAPDSPPLSSDGTDGAVSGAIGEAIRLRHAGILATVLDHFAQHAEPELYRTALDRAFARACRSFNVEAIPVLIDAGANLNQTYPAKDAAGMDTTWNIEDVVRAAKGDPIRQQQTIAVLQAARARSALRNALGTAAGLDISP